MYVAASVQELPHVIYLGNIPVENVAAEERAGQSAGRNTGATRRTPIAGLDREGSEFFTLSQITYTYGNIS